MNVQRVVCASAFLALTFVWLPHTSHAFADGLNNGRHDIGGSIEPGAGGWRTWVISSGKDYRVPPPPGPALTRAELKFVANLVSHNSDWTRERIAYWDAGSPGYRWLEIISNKVLAGQPATTYPHRVYAYMALAMYDATIATWESKYHYKRERPSELGQRLDTELPVPDSPSYPSEHAAAAQAAASVLAYFFPPGGCGVPTDGRGGGLVARYGGAAVSK